MNFRRVALACLLLLPAAARANPPSDGPYQAVEQQFEAGKYTLAIQLLQAILNQNPGDASAHYWLDRCYYELRDYDNAVAQGEKAVQLAANDSLYHLWLGRSYGGKADRDRSFFLARKTKHEFEEAVRLDPKNIRARRDLMEFLAEAPWIVGGSKDDARGQADAIALIDPVEGHLARADFWRELKKFDLVAAEYRAVFDARPASVEAYIEIAEFDVQQSDATALETAIAAAARVKPSDPRLPFFRGVSGVISGNALPQAEQYLKSYLASTPERSDWPSHAGARVWLGKLYEREGKSGDAAEQYRAALQIDPGHKEAKDRLANLEKRSR